MALLDYTDLNRQQNITLETAGQTLANTLATSILAWAQGYLGFTFATGAVTDYFDGNERRFWLSNTISPANPSVSTYNATSDDWESFTDTIRLIGSAVETRYPIGYGWRSVKITYTAGWSEADFADTDLKQALTELLALKFNSASSGGKELKRVQAGSYTAEYAVSVKEIPADILEVIDRYRPIIVA